MKNFKELQKKVCETIFYYKRCEMQEYKLNLINSTEKIYLENCPSYFTGLSVNESIQLFDKATSILLKEEREIIENQMNQAENYWWLDFYSRATFYRIAKTTYLKFLDLLGESN